MKHCRIIFLPVLLLVCSVLCSCRTGKTVDGKDCFTLSKSEETELIELARLSLRRPNRQLTAEERQMIQTGVPEVTIRYDGDCCGDMIVRWTLKGKKAGVFYRGLLNDPHQRVMLFEIVPDTDYIIYKGVPGKRDTVQ